MSDLKPLPCPFCGHTGLSFEEGSTFRWGVASCDGCDATCGEIRRNYPDDGKWHAEAIEAWNRRAQPAQAVPLLTEREIVKCLTASGCVGTVKMSYDSGPYEITRTSVNADRFARAIESLVRSKLGAGVGWQPIETAPRDGTNILLRFGQDGVSQGKYVPGAVVHPWKFIDTGDGITWLVNHAVDGPGGPSHWMPLPPPGIVGKEGA